MEQLSPEEDDGAAISSSRIREMLFQGKLEQANGMLGYPYMIQGAIVTGEQRGRQLGFPTANIRLDPEYLLPCYGVYLVRVHIEGASFFGLANVGVKPTFGEFAPLIEIYLFDVMRDLYQKMAEVEFLHYIRPERRFSGAEALQEQIRRDLQIARELMTK
jgi:riboflavin kinase/FMN adenylyltransferase